MTEILSVSHSRVESFLKCRRKDYYGYELGLTRKDTSPALMYGTASHSVLEAFYRELVGLPAVDVFNGIEDDENWDRAHTAAMAQLEKLELEGYEDPHNRVPLRDLIGVYLENEPFYQYGYEILAVEKAFNLKISDELSYTFVIDLIVRDRQGRIAVVDHKNVYDFISEEATRLLPQIPKYIGALRALGLPADYGIYNQLRTRKIKAPRLDQQLKVLPVHPTDERIVRTFEEQILVAEEIHERAQLPMEEKDHLALRVANDKICGFCDFRTICAEQLEGGDWEHVRDAFYRQRDQREGVPITEDDIED